MHKSEIGGSSEESSRPEAMTSGELTQTLNALRQGADSLVKHSISQRIDLVNECIETVGAAATAWVEAACQAKRIPLGSRARTEEITAGPLATLRFLQLIAQTLRDIRVGGRPRLPGPVTQVGGQCRVPVFPTKQLYDSLLFQPTQAETWLANDVPPEDLQSRGTARMIGQNVSPHIEVVLGAGNVAAIPATDALTKILIENKAVALKMNPVNAYLGPHFQHALQPLIRSGMLRLIDGGVKTGKQLIEHGLTSSVHITGSIESHDNIVWGSGEDRELRRQENRPVLTKPITSELGNVTPWAIVPGRYREAELRAQAENIATSIVNNVSFNCIATKIILTSRHWPQRERFFQILDEILRSTPTRYAYYPGAAERFTRFSGQQPADPERLHWTLLREIDPSETPYLLQQESFTPVCGELVIDADSDVDFLDQAVDFMNDRIWGTLAATVTVPTDFVSQQAPILDAALQRLRYGTIGINQWPALSFALMSPPWGGYPSSDLRDAQSGIGFVHNTYLLDQPEKTVLRAPLCVKPKPIWHSAHRHPERVAWDLLHVYRKPTWLRMPALFVSSLTG